MISLYRKYTWNDLELARQILHFQVRLVVLNFFGTETITTGKPEVRFETLNSIMANTIDVW